MQTFRRIVTRTDSSGKSVLASDSVVPPVEMGEVNFCHAVTGSDNVELRLDHTAIPFYPGQGESIFRIFTIPPGTPGISPAEMAEIGERFFTVTGQSTRVDTTRHPLMHTTPSIDYIMLLSGSASLLLDEGDPVALSPFDVVIQQSTNHAWIATGIEPATFAAVLVGCRLSKVEQA